MPQTGHLLFGTEPKQRLRLVQCGTAFLLVTGNALIMQVLVHQGMAPARPVAWWSLVMLAGFAGFFAFIRSGRNLAYRDPSLTVAQMLFGIGCAAAQYAIAGQARGAAFPVLMITFMFSMNALSSRQVLRMSVFAVALFGVTMAVMAGRDPQVYLPVVEWVHFAVIAVMVPAIAFLAAQFSRLRDRLRRQRKDLELALSRIQELATRDEVTGLINRRHMLELMEQERQRGVRSGQTFSIAVLELDQYSQALGLQADEMVQRFSNEALNVIRMSDLLGRLDENLFLLMLSNTHASLGRLSLERLRERVHAMAGDGASVSTPVMSFSAGVTEHRAGEPVSDTVQRAEHALRSARETGHDRVVTA